jgi:hypothetical protein
MPEWLPLARPSVAAEELDGETVLYDPQGRRLLVLNESGSAVWRCCDGSTTVAGLVDHLAGALGVASGAIAGDVVDFLMALRDSGLVVDGARDGHSSPGTGAAG